MDLQEAIKERHSVNSYSDKKIEGEVLKKIRDVIDECNRNSGLHIQLCLNEPTAFTGMMAKYGKFQNVRNYIALVGVNNDSLEEKCGYYGEKIVLEAQRLGLNTRWVGMSFNKGKCKKAISVNPGEKLLMVIAIGYGTTTGKGHKTKTIQELSKTCGSLPEWFSSGVEAARLAPTAMNQQKFCFELDGNKVRITPGSGFNTKIDMGIAKYHFEIGAGTDNWKWA